jgi:hypothetical protein
MAAGFTSLQATLLDTAVTMLMTLSATHHQEILDEVAALRRVLMAKAVFTEAELEAASAGRRPRRRAPSRVTPRSGSVGGDRHDP